jgi:hypothetical protein
MMSILYYVPCVWTLQIGHQIHSYSGKESKSCLVVVFFLVVYPKIGWIKILFCISHTFFTSIFSLFCIYTFCESQDDARLDTCGLVVVELALLPCEYYDGRRKKGKLYADYTWKRLDLELFWWTMLFFVNCHTLHTTRLLIMSWKYCVLICIFFSFSNTTLTSLALPDDWDVFRLACCCEHLGNKKKRKIKWNDCNFHKFYSIFYFFLVDCHEYLFGLHTHIVHTHILVYIAGIDMLFISKLQWDKACHLLVGWVAIVIVNIFCVIGRVLMIILQRVWKRMIIII